MTSTRRQCRVRGAAAAGCLLVAVMTERSAAFLVAPGAFGAHGGRATTTMSAMTSSVLSPSAFSRVGLVGGDAAAERSSSRRRGAEAATGSFRIGFAPKPTTSRQYGRGDRSGGQGERGSTGNPEINEEIMVRVVAYYLAGSTVSIRCMHNKLHKK